MLSDIATIITELAIIAGFVIPIFLKIRKLADGARCQLRSEMLRIYYRHHDEKQLRQYEFENFTYLYEAYKELKGNTFVKKIYSEVKTWDVIS